mmetsp:Transcript_11192/g.24213  ORF Transcript_11192/g.24213 Transcript_11192/m.24213 type:complete len:142 (-) Transcript_11192:141-566(-)
MTALSHARRLLVEFKAMGAGYAAFGAGMGVLCGAMDGPAPASEPPTRAAELVPGERPSFAAVKQQVSRHPRELGVVRQLLLTFPGICLALPLGRRGHAAGAPFASMAICVTALIWCPLLLYLYGGYPAGIALHRHFAARSE